MKTKRRRRLNTVVLLTLGIASAIGLGLYALKNNLMYYYDVTQVVAGEPPIERAFKTGGLVKEGSVIRSSETTQVSFIITDLKSDVTVHYDGILPDLFTEGQGIVADGKLQSDGTFLASNVLAKHDQNYMPPEVAESLKDAGQMPQHEMVKDKNETKRLN